MPSPFTAQIHQDGIIFNQVAKLFFSNPLFWKCSPESEFQTAFHLNDLLKGICRVRVNLFVHCEVNKFHFYLPLLHWLRWTGKLGKKASSRLKTAMTWSQCMVCSQAPEEKQGAAVPSLGEIVDQAVSQHVTMWCPNFTGKKSIQLQPVMLHYFPCSAIKTSVSGLAAWHREKQFHRAWFATALPCVIHLFHVGSCGALSPPPYSSPLGSYINNRWSYFSFKLIRYLQHMGCSQ